MICHVVLIRLKDESEGARLLARARELLGLIPVVRNLRVGTGLGKKDERAHPFALVMEFDDEAALEAYQVHPRHQEFVKDVVSPLQEDKKVFDYRC
jgi:hypothetical protein